MRIILAAGIFPPDIGGPATYAWKLAQYLVRLKHDVHVICFGGRTSTEVLNGITIHRIKRSTLKLMIYGAYFFTLVRYARRGHLLYAQGPVAGGIQSMLVSKLFHIPYVVKVTGDYAWEQAVSRFNILVGIDAFQKTHRGLPLVVRIMRGIQRIVARHASSVIVPSMYLRELVKGWGVRDQSIHVIYNGVEIPNRPLSRAEARQRLHSTGSVIISVGRLVPWKGFLTLIKVWPRVVEAVPDSQLVILGHGPDRDHLERMVESYKLHRSVHVYGQCSSRELGLWYRAADVFILNSSYEGLSHAILEAQAHEVPCAVSNAGGNPEIVEHEQTGLLFRHNDGQAIVRVLCRLLTDKATAYMYAMKAKQQLSRFAMHEMLTQTVHFLERLASPVS